jgi:hypothetical protein
MQMFHKMLGLSAVTADAVTALAESRLLVGRVMTRKLKNDWENKGSLE